MTPIAVMDNNFLLNTRSRLRSHAASRSLAEMMMETENGQKLKLFTRSVAVRSVWRRYRTARSLAYTHKRWPKHKIRKKIKWRRTSIVSVWQDGARAQTQARASSKDEAKWWICKYFFTFFSILFCFCRIFRSTVCCRSRSGRKVANVIKRPRSRAWCGHLSILEPFVFMENEALFRFLHKFSYSTHLRQWAHGQMGNSNTGKENRNAALTGWLAAGWWRYGETQM